MKVSSFKKFLEEEDSKAIIKTGLNSKSIDNSVTKEIINSRLAMATNNPFLTPYIALGSIARVLAYANIVVPQYTFLQRDEGEVVFDATQVGQIAGVNIDGSPARSEADHFIYFSYSMNDDGYYDCFAALVDSDELERIMDMGGDDTVDHLDVDQRVNEENDYFAGVRPSLDVFKHTDEKGTKHFLAFHKNGDITYHNKTSDGTVGNSHPEMKPLYAKSSKDHMHNALYDFVRHVAKEKADEQTQINEISAKTYGNYIRKASRDIEDRAGTVADVKQQKSGFTQGSYYHTHLSNVEKNQQKKVDQRKRGISTATNKLVSKANEELKGDQHKLDVAEPKGKLTSADFKKLRGEEVDEGFDKWRNKLKKRDWLRKSGYKKSSVDHTSPGNTAAMAVRAGRDKLKKEEAQHVDEAMNWDEKNASLPAIKQPNIKAHQQAAKIHGKMLSQARKNYENDKTPENAKAVWFHDAKIKYHNNHASIMRMQGVKEEAQHVDEESINELNTDTLKSYKRKAEAEVRSIKNKRANDPRGRISDADFEKKEKRMIGINQASRRIEKRDILKKEEAQHVDEEPTNPAAQAAQELKARIAAHQQTKKK